jgi:DNA-binding FadR family transcriptional regulator
MFKKIRTSKVYIKIVEQIKELVRNGELKPGDQLPSEIVLAEKFGASRASLREALCSLEILGITESRGGKGNFIRNDINYSDLINNQHFEKLETEAEPIEIIEARKLIETQVVILASERANDEDLDQLKRSLEKMGNKESLISEIMEADREFHSHLAKSTHNSILFSVMNHIIDLMDESLWRSLKEKQMSVTKTRLKYHSEHYEIYKAIENRNKEVASMKILEHLLSVENDLFV